MLDKLLAYHESPEPDEFTARVMRRVHRQRRQRRLILWSTGIVGALFGASGVLLLSEPLARLFMDVGAVPLGLATVGGAGLLAWLLLDETAPG